jgi:hypothetical protein
MSTPPLQTLYCRPSDIVTAAATLTASGAVSADPNYGLSALYDRLPAKPCKFETDGPIRIVYDFGAPQRVDAFALPNHNLDNGLECIVAANATDSWGAPTVQASMIVGPAHPDGHRSSPWTNLTTASGYSPAGLRYLSLYVPANSVPIKLGETLVIETLRRFTRWTDFGTRGLRIPYLESITTDYGVQRVYRRRVSQRTYDYRFNGNEQDWIDLKALLEDAGGLALPWFFVAESQNVEDEGLYVRFTSDVASHVQATEQWFDFHGLRLSVQELSRSIPL